MSVDVLAQMLDWMKHRYFGKYRGVVVSNADPTHRGRLKVKVESVLDTLEVWAMPCVPYAGKNVGLFAMPPKDSGVWIEFEGGDVSFPIWVGCFWADKEAPHEGDPEFKVWKTDAITLTLDDKEDTVLLENSSSASVKMTRDIVSTATSATHSVTTSGIVSEIAGGKLEVAPASVLIMNGMMEVK
jgi:hypothetical protein